MPVIGHLEGTVHVYVHRAADLAHGTGRSSMNAKMRRTGICGAAETLLIDAGLPGDALAADRQGAAGRGLRAAGRRGASRRPMAGVRPATEDDWCTEYLDAILACAGRGRRGRGDPAHRPLRVRPY